MQHPAEYGQHGSFPDFLRSRWSITGDDIEQDFVPAYEQFLRGMCDPTCPPRALGLALLQLHLHLRYFDYDVTQTHPAVWHTFVRVMQDEWRQAHLLESAPPISDLHDAWRCLYRLLLPLALDVPEFDLAHSSSAGYCGLPCVVAKLRHHTPYLVTEQGIYLREQHLAFGRMALAPFVRWFLSKLATAIVAVNYEFADQVSPVTTHHMRWEQWLGVEAARIKTIYNGVDALAPGREGLRPGVPTVVTGGPITATSGHTDLIEAAALVRRTMPHVRFRFCASGDHGEISHCRELVHNLGLDLTVMFEENVSDARALLQDADVVALPTLSDVFPHSLLDAMMLERAIVATSIGGIPEAVGETALLVAPGNPAAMAESIETLLKSPDSSRYLGEHAGKRAQEMFPKSRFVEAYRSSYETLTGRAPIDQRVAIVESTNETAAPPTIPTAA
jgi:polysaccharide biosynthesis protein PelF